MATHTFDVDAFRARFPPFADETLYPDALLQGYFDMATCFVSPVDWCGLNGNCMDLALQYATAHLAELANQNTTGDAVTGVQTGATVDKVSVSLQAPPIKNGFQQWLALTQYGLALWTLLSIKGAGGFYVGGSAERAGFRKGGGGFYP